VSGSFEGARDDLVNWQAFESIDDLQPVTCLTESASPALSDSWIMLDCSATDIDGTHPELLLISIDLPAEH